MVPVEIPPPPASIPIQNIKTNATKAITFSSIQTQYSYLCFCHNNSILIREEQDQSIIPWELAEAGGGSRSGEGEGAGVTWR